MRERSFISPARYIQGPHVLSSLHRYVSPLGKTCFVILSKGGLRRMASVLDANRTAAPDLQLIAAALDGECCMAEIDRLTGEARAAGACCIVGIGGGKVLDTAKAVAHFADLPVVVAPTTASSDAPCSALSVVYHPDGSLDTLLSLRRNPDTVLVDSAVIVTASPRLFAAGMGDAMATYFEMRAARATGGSNFIGTQITLAAEAIATRCGQVLFDDGCAAYDAVQVGVLTAAVENVIEANTLLSGLGFESGGVCAAHPINNGLAELPATHGRYHGEKVAFALLAQLVLENAPREELERVMAFHTHVGLPVTLAGLGIEALTPEELHTVAAIANSDGSIHQLRVPVDEDNIAAAVLAADAMGRRYRQQGRL